MAKRKRRKATLHSAGKVQEADILERARALRDEPSLAMPICDGPCVLFSPVAAARKGILKAALARDDASKLARLASSGNDLARAYAATILLAHEEKIPYVAELRLPGKQSASYVVRGKAKPFFLAGLQNHDDRQLRLLAMMPWVKKRRIHVYSADRGLVCTGRRDAPPRDFVEEEAEILGLQSRGSDRFVCEHGGHGPGRDALVIAWKSAGVTFERCTQCFEEVPTLAHIARHLAVPTGLRGFALSAALAPLEAVAGAPVNAPAPIPPGELAMYGAGQKTDADLIEAARLGRTEALRARTGRLFVAGDASYGADVDAFIAAIRPNATEERALRAALATREKPLVVDRPTSARVLAELWPDHGLQMLEAVGGSEAAKRLHRERAGADEAQDLVRRAEREGAKGRVVAELPTYRNLPPAAATADAIARAFRESGQEAAVRIAFERASGGKAKGVALAFLHALHAGKGQEWRFGSTDHELAQSLDAHAERLLRGPASGYHDALRETSALAGETGTFSPER